MSENTQSEYVAPANLDNVALKQWLRDKGAVGRREALTKLKAELQNLGLSRRQVHRGLLQLSSKPRILLTRHTGCSRYGSKQSLEHGNHETDAAFLESQSRSEDEDVQILDSVQGIVEEDSSRDEKMQGMKKFELKQSTDSDRSISSKSCKSNDHRTATVHSFDKALKQLDCIFSSKMNADKLNPKRASVIASIECSKLQSKSHAMYLNEEKAENPRIVTKDDNFDLICDKVGHGMVYTAERSKATRIKLHLKSSSNRKQASFAKLDVQRESGAVVKDTRVQADCASNQKKRVKEDNHETGFVQNKIAKVEEDKGTIYSTFVQSRRKRIHETVNEPYSKRMMKNLRYKFRVCFGNCNSVSEDEQERDIMQKRFKRRRKTNSVDSCDSGVCINDGNSMAANSGIEILKDIQKAVPDSTMHISEETSSDKTIVEADTIDTSKDNVNRDENVEETSQAESVIDHENDQSHNDTSEVDDNEIIQKKSHCASDESNLVQSTTTLDVAETPSEIEKSTISVPGSGEADAENDISSCNTRTILNLNCEKDVTKDLLKTQAPSSDLKDLNELFEMNFSETCQITSNGNVLSIQEKDTNQNIISKDTDANIPLRILLETTQADCNEKAEPPSNVVNNNISLNDTGSSCNMKRNIETVPVKINLSSLLSNMDKNILPKSKLHDILEKKSKVTLSNSESTDIVQRKEEITILDSVLNVTTEKKDETELLDSKGENNNAQSNQVPKIKLRVLSSAELGSRWCPTPVNAVISTSSELSNTNTVTRSDNNLTCITTDQVPSSSITIQAVPMTQPIISTAAPKKPVSGETASSNLKKSSKDPRFAKAVYNSLVTIYKLILNTRISHVDYNNALLKEFENLRKILNIENRAHLINGVITILNKQLLLHQPLSLSELLYYIPSFKSLYRSKLYELINPNGYQNIVPNKTATQNTYNSQGLQSTPITSIQHLLQNVFSAFTPQTSAPVNIISEPVQQNCPQMVFQQPQNNPIQNNVPMNSAATNCGPQQINYRMSMQRSVPKQTVPQNAYFMRQHPVNNVPAQQCTSMQYFSPLLVNNSQPGIRYNQPPAVSATNTFIHSYMSPVNTFCNVNAMNYTPQQNMNQTQGKNTKNSNVPCAGPQMQNTVHRQPVYNIPQGIQSQNIPVIINRSMPNVQDTFVSNPSQSLPRNVQNNEQIYQKGPVQAETRVPQNIQSKPAPSVQQTQFARKQQNATQISLESTMKQFAVLKYLSGIQKILLLKQIESYFGCTSWLQQQFTSKQWQVIHSERSLLLHFQTLLKHIVEKTVSDLLPNTSQSSIFENNIQISVPQTVQIIIHDNEQTHCQAERLNATEQCKTANTNESDVPRQENINISTSKNQSENGQRTVDNLPKKQLPNQAQESEILQNEEIQRDEQIEETLIQQNQSAVTLTSEIQKIPENNLNEKDMLKKETEDSADLCSFNRNEQSSVVSPNLKVSYKDTLQQSNPHLVTVAISSHDDKVTVIDPNAVSKDEDEVIESVVEEIKECEQPEEEEAKVSGDSVKFVADIKPLSNADFENIALEDTSIIADVRSITLKAFEEMEANNLIASNSEGDIEEEEIKVCLVCGKPSTLACAFCIEAKYCSKECSDLHWEEHNQDCKPVKNSVFIV